MTPTPTHKALTPAGEWVEGWFDHSVELNPLMIVIADNYKGYNFRSVFLSTVCRATGLTDKNGNHIWEGDELELDGMKFYVDWFDGGFHLGRNENQTKSPISQDRTRKFTLTGQNIHDKPSVE